MCMNYVNGTVRSYRHIQEEDGRILAYEVPFDQIKGRRLKDKVFLPTCYFVIQLSFRGTNSEAGKPQNPLEMGKSLNFMLRLTKCDVDPENRIGTDLGAFSVNLAEAGQMDHACFSFLNADHIIKVDDLELPGGYGPYVLKLLVKESGGDWSIQSMSELDILEAI